jgi:hypothetical protein
MKLKTALVTVAAIFCVGIFASLATAQARVVVRFSKGHDAASAKGSIKGYTYIDYVLGAKAGQHMLIELTSTEDKAQMVVLDPDKQNVDEGTGVQAYSGDLEKSGNYTVRILMSRAGARRRGAATSFVITFTIK